MDTPDPLSGAPALLTVVEVAAALRCSKMHVYRLINKGALSTVDIRVPGSLKPKTRVTPEDLQRFINGVPQ